MEKIKIPNSTEDMTLDHLPFYLALSDLGVETTEDIDIVTKTDLNAIFFGKDTSDFDKFTAQSNENIFNEICMSVLNHKSKPVRDRIKIGDTVYTWWQDYSKMPVSFHRDLKNADLRDEPELMLGFVYIEEGMHYNELDELKNIKNELRVRSKRLMPHFTLADYIDLQAFFLESYNVLSPSINLLKLKRRLRANGIGKNQ